jgi:hypothetical protein
MERLKGKVAELEEGDYAEDILVSERMQTLSSVQC